LNVRIYGRPYVEARNNYYQFFSTVWHLFFIPVPTAGRHGKTNANVIQKEIWTGGRQAGPGENFPLVPRPMADRVESKH
jgi:hypothetical protein